VVTLFGATLAFMLWKDKPGVDLLIGALAMSFGTVIGYWFGASKSSDEKTKLLAKADAIR
jgi:hypothetical protein